MSVIYRKRLLLSGRTIVARTILGITAEVIGARKGQSFGGWPATRTQALTDRSKVGY